MVIITTGIVIVTCKQGAEYRAVIVALSLEKPKAEFAFSAFLFIFLWEGRKTMSVLKFMGLFCSVDLVCLF